MKKIIITLLAFGLLLGFTSAKRSYSFPNNPKCNTSYRADTLCRIEKALSQGYTLTSHKLTKQGLTCLTKMVMFPRGPVKQGFCLSTADISKAQINKFYDSMGVE